MVEAWDFLFRKVLVRFGQFGGNAGTEILRRLHRGQSGQYLGVVDHVPGPNSCVELWWQHWQRT